jgi:hypothetical protein
MSGFSNAAQSAFLALFFQNTNFAQAPVLQGSSSAGSLYIALHTSTGPGVGGTQSTNEAAWTGYSRQAVVRSSSGWTVTGSSPTTAENAAAITWSACTGGTETDTYVSIGQETSGAGVVYCICQVTTPSGGLSVSSGITPSIPIDDLTFTLD